MEDNFRQLDRDEILSLRYKDLGDRIGLQPNHSDCCYFKPDDFAAALIKRLSIHHDTTVDIFEGRIECEALQFNSQRWTKGKLKARIVVEFCPDKTEEEAASVGDETASPLDDVRQMMNE